MRHRAVHILLFNEKGELFLQKRSRWKDRHPLAWDSSAAGHVEAGEDYDATAVREVWEEIGLRLAAVPKRLFKIDARPETDQEFVWVYRCESEGPFKLHPDEIDQGDWFSPEEVSRWVAAKPEEFASAFMYIWKKIVARASRP